VNPEGRQSEHAKADATGIEMEGGPVEEVGVQRSNTSSSKRLSVDGLKRRFGSLRKKPSAV
jgi:hypothetical protein